MENPDVIAYKKSRQLALWTEWHTEHLAKLAKGSNPKQLKTKYLYDFPQEFNPGSGKQLAGLLHDTCLLPVIETTKTGLAATDGDTLEALVNHTIDQSVKDLLEALIGWAKVEKILTSFIPAFEKAVLSDDGMHYLFGNFNLGGTKSGRMSSSDPNLQNLPSGSLYGKLIKDCFRGNLEWVFGGADYASLEDYISALTTKDPNKLKVYTDGYDGHCLRAFSYFPERCIGIVNTLESINTIKDLYPEVRQDSKPDTFSLTYQGTWRTLVKNSGHAEEVAKRIEGNFKELYAVSIQYVEDKLKQACTDGYVTCAFGLRLRTPILAQTVWCPDVMTGAAKKEGRTAGNALGQSYGLLNNRAANEFACRLRASKYRLDVRLCSMIHDACYLMWRNNIDVTHWVNKNLTECMAWQDLPELEHPTVKLHAELDIFYPSWKYGATLKADATKEDIHQTCVAHLVKLREKGLHL